jgi:hypothetical protein
MASTSSGMPSYSVTLYELEHSRSIQSVTAMQGVCNVSNPTCRRRHPAASEPVPLDMQLTGIRLVARLEVVGGLHSSLEKRHLVTWLSTSGLAELFCYPQEQKPGQVVTSCSPMMIERVTHTRETVISHVRRSWNYSYNANDTFDYHDSLNEHCAVGGTCSNLADNGCLLSNSYRYSEAQLARRRWCQPEAPINIKNQTYKTISRLMQA